MSKFFVLFPSQQEATDALDELEGKMRDAEVTVKERAAGAEARRVAAAPAGGISAHAYQAGVVHPDYDDDINSWGLNDEEAEFFRQGLEGGGTVATIEVGDEYDGEITTLLDRYQGRYKKA